MLLLTLFLLSDRGFCILFLSALFFGGLLRFLRRLLRRRKRSETKSFGFKCLRYFDKVLFAEILNSIHILFRLDDKIGTRFKIVLFE